MAYRSLLIGNLFRISPAEATRRLEAKYRECDGCTRDVARALGVNSGTVQRWVALAKRHDPKFADRLEAMRAAVPDLKIERRWPDRKVAAG